MSYQTLYRKYRPRKFSDVLGQEHITTILKNQIVSGRINHAYLFSGTRGTGKTSTAKIFARAVNCIKPQNGEPCGKCHACEHSEQESVDIIELDAASNTGVDDMRSLLDKVRFTPLELKTKVYIIDEVHMLSIQAFNALLKTLEEPPAHVIFILATTEPQQIPATIISRCQRFDFHRLKISDMVACMAQAIEDTGAVIAPEGLRVIAKAADGSMRDAMSLADQCLSFCGSNVSEADVYDVLGSMDSGFMFELADALIYSDAKRTLTLFDEVISGGRDISVFTKDLIAHFRALLLAQSCGSCTDILDCTDETMELYLAQAKRSTAERILRATELLIAAGINLKGLTMPRALIESTLVRICRPEDESSLDTVLDRLTRLEKQMSEGVVVTAPQNAEKLPASEIKPIIKVSQQRAQNKADGAEGIWTAFLNQLRSDSLPVYTLLARETNVRLDGNTLWLTLGNQLNANTLNSQSYSKIIQQAIKKAAPEHELRFESANRTDESIIKINELFGDKVEIKE